MRKDKIELVRGIFDFEPGYRVIFEPVDEPRVYTVRVMDLRSQWRSASYRVTGRQVVNKAYALALLRESLKTGPIEPRSGASVASGGQIGEMPGF